MSVKLTREQFIEKANKVHNNYFDYSKVDYVNNRTPVTIIDPVLGEFSQTPSNHLKGQGHPANKGKKVSDTKRAKFDTEKLIERFHKAHPEGGYEYPNIDYQTMDTPITIICHHLDPNGVEYGEFTQTPRIHLKGCGHPREAMDKIRSKLPHPKLTNEEYIARCNAVFDSQYIYTECHYGGIHSIVTVICPKHGAFNIDASNHLYGGKGCPHCGHSISKAEDEIYRHISAALDCEVIRRDRTILNGRELDIFIPSHSLAIEYNGCRWHTEWFSGKDRHYHYDKLTECNGKGVRLIHIFEDEYMYHKDIVLSKIEHILGIHRDLPKVGARKCDITTVSKAVSDKFLNANHIQGEVSATVYYGAFYEDKLVAVMTFIKRKEGEYELNRFATDNAIVVSGIADRMLKRFIKDYNPSIVISFADRRWTTKLEDNLYTKLGFALECCTKPDYRYYNEKVDSFLRFHKFGFRKALLHKKHGLPLTMTEEEMVRELGYDRIWDCGLAKYVLNIKS